MHFPFSGICLLLARLEAIETKDPPLLPAAKAALRKDVVASWFKSHRRLIDRLDADGGTAVLSSILPEWRTDRVYNMQSTRLCKRVGRVLRLSSAKQRMLDAYRIPGHGDLAECLAWVIEGNGPPALPPVQLIEIDEFLHQLAGCRWALDPAAAVRPPNSCEDTDRLFENLLHRMPALEAKWLIRIILKDLSPVRIDEMLVFKNYHFLLWDLLQFQRSFSAATSLLKREFVEFPRHPDPYSAKLFREAAAQRLCPVVGVKVGRPTFHKARGLDHCISMLGARKWFVDRKYDGEYCEIHVDLERWDPLDDVACICIFSKSGRNSTEDRKGLHGTIVRSLRLGKPDCRIKKRAIILGEMVVYSDVAGSIMPFENIRRHVTRAGYYIGTNQDSPPPASEHLAIVFFDALLLDDVIVMNKPFEERRHWLREIVSYIPGYAWTSERLLIDFADSARSKAQLIQHFAMSIARRHEGLILKPSDVPYITLSNEYKHSYIKLKKDLLGMGDEADFAVIGASYDAQLAAATSVRGLRWTTFHLGCLVNEEDVRRFEARPKFMPMGTIDCGGQCIPKDILKAANTLGTFEADALEPKDQNVSFELVGPSTRPHMDVIFKRPFVFEVLGSKYARPPNCNFYMLIFPRVKKLHQDRSFLDCPSFREIQELAERACALPDLESQETSEWVQRLERQCKRKLLREEAASPTFKGTVTPVRVAIDSRPSEDDIIRRHGTAHGAPTPSPSPKQQQTSLSCKQQLPARGQASSRKRCCELINDQTSIVVKRARLGPRKADPKETSAGPHAKPSPLAEISPNVRVKQSPAKNHPFGGTRSKPNCHPPDPANICRGTVCLFSSAVVFCVPCIARMLYVTDDLLPAHNATISADLCHWERDSFARATLTDIVSESQSHPGLRKIVLVERKRRQAVMDLIHRLKIMNEGMLRERIDVFDWRVLEDCANHDCSADALTRHFLGATMFDNIHQRTLFVHSATGTAQE